MIQVPGEPKPGEAQITIDYAAYIDSSKVIIKFAQTLMDIRALNKTISDSPVGAMVPAGIRETLREIQKRMEE